MWGGGARASLPAAMQSIASARGRVVGRRPQGFAPRTTPLPAMLRIASGQGRPRSA